MSEAPQRPEPLLFPPEKRRALSVILPGFLALSVIGHASAFFIFQVVYPQRVTIPMPAPQVTLVDDSTAEGRALLRWVEAEDPALVANAALVLPEQLAQVKYRPSFQTVRTAPRGAPEPPDTVQFPPARPPLEIIRSGSRQAVPPRAPLPLQATRLAFSGGLAERKVTAEYPLLLQKKAAEPLQPPTFMIGVNERGEVRHVLLQGSSGASEQARAADSEAAAHLRRLSFSPAEVPLEWGMATVQWGDDAYEKAARE
jgi:hypothetical protein